MTNNPGTPRLLRAMNDRAALDLLLEHGPLSRTRIGKLTGLSKPTASQLLARLEAAGLVLATGTTEGRPGPNAQLYEVNAGAAHVAGLDVTPARILAAVADITGETVGRVTSCRTPGRRADSVVRQVTEALDGAGEGGLDRPADSTGWSIGTPGAFDPTHRPAAVRLAPARLALPAPARRAGRGAADAGGVRERRQPRGRRRAAARRRQGQRGLRPAVERGGPGCGPRHRRPAAPRLHRRRRRGRLPARCPAPRSSARSAGQQRRLPGAGRRASTGARELGPTSRGLHCPRSPQPPSRPRCETEDAGDELLLTTLATPARHRSGLDRRRARPRTGRARRRRRSPPAASRCAHSSRPSWPSSPRPGPRLVARRRTASTRCCGAPWRAPSPPPATRSSTPRSPSDPSRARQGVRTCRTIAASPGDSAMPRTRPTVGASPCRCAALLAHPACTGQSSARRRTTTPNARRTITFWHGWSAPSEVKAIQDERRRVREGAPEHPRQGRRQHHRRQDQPGAARGRFERAGRGLVVHHRQRRQVLLVGRVRRPEAVPGEVRRRPGRRPSRRRCTTTPSSRASAARCRCWRRVRPLLQQGRVQGRRHHRAAEDAGPSSTRTRRS